MFSDYLYLSLLICEACFYVISASPIHCKQFQPTKIENLIGALIKLVLQPAVMK